MSRTLACLCCLAAALSWPWLAHASDKVVFAVGSNVGLEHEEALNFGTTDATDFSALMLELGGVAPSAIHLLLNPTKQEFEDRLDTLARKLGPDTTLIFYYSGHGNETHLHISGQSLDRAWLKAKLASSLAKLRLMFVDACRGLKERGLARTQSFDVRRVDYTGLVLIQSASRGEIAFESRQLQGGLFTRHLLSGLRGAADADDDGRVSLDEAYAFAHGHTLIDSLSTQVPDREVRIMGSGSLELTTVVQSQAVLRLPSEAPARYTVFRRGIRSVFAEAWTHPHNRVQLALPPGQYVLWRRAGEASGMAEIDAESSVVVDVAHAHFTAIDNDDMRRRGGVLQDVLPHRITLHAGIVVAPKLANDADTGFGETLSIDYAWVARESGWSPTLGFAFYREQSSAIEDSYRVERESYQAWAGALSPRFAIGPLYLYGIVGLSTAVTSQTLSYSFGSASSSTQFVRFGAVAEVSAEVPISEMIGWAVNLSVNPAVFRERANTFVRASAAEVTISAVVLATTGIAFRL